VSCHIFLRRILAIWLTKLAVIAGKIAGKKGSSTPGRLALKIYPNILRDLAKEVSGPIIVTCGTNGKTTTNNLLAAILKSTGKRIVCNYVGANMLEGVVTAFVMSTRFWGKIEASFAAIELDEISTVKVFEHFLPQYIMVTNLFRDQLDRYGEIDITIDVLNRAIEMAKGAELILNADDPLVVSLARKDRKCHFFGVPSKVIDDPDSNIKEGRFCRNCGEELDYQFYHYSQLGMYACPSCDFKRPEAEFDAHNVDLSRGIKMKVQNNEIYVKYRGFYNIYNILAAYCASSLVKVSLSEINSVLNAYKPQIGRMEEFDIAGKTVVFNLSKNPAGFNQAIRTLLQDGSKKSVVVAINDNAQDGKDISWIWDVDFEELKGNVYEIATSGIRHHDVYLRMKYEDFDLSHITDYGDIESAIKMMLKSDCETLYVLVNYTALFSTQNILKRLETRNNENHDRTSLS